MKQKLLTVLLVLTSLAMNQVVLNAQQACDNLISYWRFEESIGNTYMDMAGGHHAMAITSAPSQVDGKVGYAQSFNGTTNYLQVSDHMDFDWAGTQSFTIELWVKLNSISSADNMIFVGRDEVVGNVHWWLGAEKNTGRSMFVLTDTEGTQNIAYGPNLSIGTWYHMVAIRDAVSGSNKLYINNNLVDNNAVDYSSGSFGADAQLDIGFLAYNGMTTRFYAPAVIDELAIYNNALTADDIDLHYNNGIFGIGYCQDYSPYFLSHPDTLAVVNSEFIYEAYATGLPNMTYGLVSGPGSMNSSTGVYKWTPTSISQSGATVTIGATNSQGTTTQTFKIYLAEAPTCPSEIQNMYKLDDASSPYVDFVGGNHAEATNAPTSTTGKFNGAQLFDGVNDGINIPDDGNLNFGATSSFSFEFWIKTPGKAGTQVALGRQGTIAYPDTSKLHMWVGVLNTGNAAFYLRDAKGNEPADALLSGGAVSDNIWHYIVAVRDGASSKSYLYVDGAEVAVSEGFAYSNSFGTFEGDPFNMGYMLRQTGEAAYFVNGALDEVAIYRRALSAGEISTNYINSFTGSWHCQPGNYAPIFDTNPVTSALEGATYTYSIETSDIDEGDALILSATSKPSWLSFTSTGPGKGLLSGIPTNAEVGGQHDVVLTVTDGKTPITQEFSINVVNNEEPPEITSSPSVNVDEDDTYTYTVIATDPDAGDILTYSATTLPSWLFFNADTHILSGVPKNDDVGDHQVVLEVSDGLLSDTQDFTITVKNVNDPPVITAQQVLVTDEDQPITLTMSDFTVVDVDNTPAELTLVVENGTNYSYSGTVVTPDLNFNGTLIVNVRVSDLESNSESFAAEVEVDPVNDAPVFSTEPIRDAVVDVLYGLPVSASDPDGDVITMSPVAIPDFLTFDAGSGFLVGTPTVDDVGDHIVAVKASDGVAETPYSYTLTVWRWPGGPLAVELNEIVQRVYPIPADNVIHIEISIEEDASLTVLDMSGKKVIEKKYAAGESKISLDVSGLKEGSYIFRLHAGEHTSVQSFVINR